MNETVRDERENSETTRPSSIDSRKKLNLANIKDSLAIIFSEGESRRRDRPARSTNVGRAQSLRFASSLSAQYRESLVDGRSRSFVFNSKRKHDRNPNDDDGESSLSSLSGSLSSIAEDSVIVVDDDLLQTKRRQKKKVSKSVKILKYRKLDEKSGSGAWAQPTLDKTPLPHPESPSKIAARKKSRLKYHKNRLKKVLPFLLLSRGFKTKKKGAYEMEPTKTTTAMSERDDAHEESGSNSSSISLLSASVGYEADISHSIYNEFIAEPPRDASIGNDVRGENDILNVQISAILSTNTGGNDVQSEESAISETNEIEFVNENSYVQSIGNNAKNSTFDFDDTHSVILDVNAVQETETTASGDALEVVDVSVESRNTIVHGNKAAAYNDNYSLTNNVYAKDEFLMMSTQQKSIPEAELMRTKEGNDDNAERIMSVVAREGGQFVERDVPMNYHHQQLTNDVMKNYEEPLVRDTEICKRLCFDVAINGNNSRIQNRSSKNDLSNRDAVNSTSNYTSFENRPDFDCSRGSRTGEVFDDDDLFQDNSGDQKTRLIVDGHGSHNDRRPPLSMDFSVNGSILNSYCENQNINVYDRKHSTTGEDVPENAEISLRNEIDIKSSSDGGYAQNRRINDGVIYRNINVSSEFDILEGENGFIENNFRSYDSDKKSFENHDLKTKNLNSNDIEKSTREKFNRKDRISSRRPKQKESGCCEKIEKVVHECEKENVRASQNSGNIGGSRRKDEGVVQESTSRVKNRGRFNSPPEVSNSKSIKPTRPLSRSQSERISMSSTSSSSGRVSSQQFDRKSSFRKSMTKSRPSSSTSSGTEDSKWAALTRGTPVRRSQGAGSTARLSDPTGGFSRDDTKRKSLSTTSVNRTPSSRSNQTNVRGDKHEKQEKPVETASATDVAHAAGRRSSDTPDVSVETRRIVGQIQPKTVDHGASLDSVFDEPPAGWLSKPAVARSRADLPTKPSAESNDSVSSPGGPAFSESSGNVANVSGKKKQQLAVTSSLRQSQSQTWNSAASTNKKPNQPVTSGALDKTRPKSASASNVRKSNQSEMSVFDRLSSSRGSLREKKNQAMPETTRDATSKVGKVVNTKSRTVSNTSSETAQKRMRSVTDTSNTSRGNSAPTKNTIKRSLSSGNGVSKNGAAVPKTNSESTPSSASKTDSRRSSGDSLKKPATAPKKSEKSSTSDKVRRSFDESTQPIQHRIDQKPTATEKKFETTTTKQTRKERPKSADVKSIRPASLPVGDSPAVELSSSSSSSSIPSKTQRKLSEENTTKEKSGLIGILKSPQKSGSLQNLHEATERMSLSSAAFMTPGSSASLPRSRTKSYCNISEKSPARVRFGSTSMLHTPPGSPLAPRRVSSGGEDVSRCSAEMKSILKGLDNNKPLSPPVTSPGQGPSKPNFPNNGRTITSPLTLQLLQRTGRRTSPSNSPTPATVLHRSGRGTPPADKPSPSYNNDGHNNRTIPALQQYDWNKGASTPPRLMSPPPPGAVATFKIHKNAPLSGTHGLHEPSPVIGIHGVQNVKPERRELPPPIQIHRRSITGKSSPSASSPTRDGVSAVQSMSSLRVSSPVHKIILGDAGLSLKAATANVSSPKVTSGSSDSEVREINAKVIDSRVYDRGSSPHGTPGSSDNESKASYPGIGFATQRRTDAKMPAAAISSESESERERTISSSSSDNSKKLLTFKDIAMMQRQTGAKPQPIKEDRTPDCKFTVVSRPPTPKKKTSLTLPQQHKGLLSPREERSETANEDGTVENGRVISETHITRNVRKARGHGIMLKTAGKTFRRVQSSDASDDTESELQDVFPGESQPFSSESDTGYEETSGDQGSPPSVGIARPRREATIPVRPEAEDSTKSRSDEYLSDNRQSIDSGIPIHSKRDDENFSDDSLEGCLDDVETPKIQRKFNEDLQSENWNNKLVCSSNDDDNSGNVLLVKTNEEIGFRQTDLSPKTDNSGENDISCNVNSIEQLVVVGDSNIIQGHSGTFIDQSTAACIIANVREKNDLNSVNPPVCTLNYDVTNKVDAVAGSGDPRTATTADSSVDVTRAGSRLVESELTLLLDRAEIADTAVEPPAVGTQRDDNHSEFRIYENNEEVISIGGGEEDSVLNHDDTTVTLRKSNNDVEAVKLRSTSYMIATNPDLVNSDDDSVDDDTARLKHNAASASINRQMADRHQRPLAVIIDDRDRSRLEEEKIVESESNATKNVTATPAGSAMSRLFTGRSLPRDTINPSENAASKKSAAAVVAAPTIYRSSDVERQLRLLASISPEKKSSDSTQCDEPVFTLATDNTIASSVAAISTNTDIKNASSSETDTTTAEYTGSNYSNQHSIVVPSREKRTDENSVPVSCEPETDDETVAGNADGNDGLRETSGLSPTIEGRVFDSPAGIIARSNDDGRRHLRLPMTSSPKPTPTTAVLTQQSAQVTTMTPEHPEAISAPAPGQRDGDENDDKVDEDENDDTLNDEIAAERFNAAALRFRRSNSLPSNLRQTSQLLQLTGREVQTRVTDSRDALDILLRSSAETPDGAGGQAIRRHLFAPASSGSMPPNVGRNIISRNSVRNMGADESTMTGPESDWSTDGEETYAMYQGFAGVRRRVSASSQSSYQSAIWRRSWGEGSTSFSFSNLRRKRADSRKSDVFDYDKFAMDHQAQRLTKPDDRSTTPTGATPDEELKSNHFVKNRANNAAAAAAHYSPSVVLRKTEKRAKRTRPSSTGDSMDYTRGGQAEFASTLRAAVSAENFDENDERDETLNKSLSETALTSPPEQTVKVTAAKSMQDVTPRQRKTSKNKKEGLSFLRMMFYKRRKEKDQAEGLAFQSDDETAEEVTPPSVDNMNRVASVRPAHEESTTKRVSSVDGEDLSETQRDESEFKAEKWMPQKSFVSYIPDFPVHSSDGSDNERRVPSLSVTRLNTGDADRNNRLNVADGEPHRPRSPKPHSTRADQTEQIAQQRQRSRSSPKTLKLQLVKKEKSSTKLARNKSSLARTESFRIPRKQRCDALKDEHDDAFIRGVLYRGSGSKRVPILVKSKTPPVTGGDEVSPKKTILIETEKVRKPLVSDSDLSNTKKHQQHGILRSSNHRQNVGKPDASSLRRLSKQDLWNMAADVRETFERILPDNRESAGDRPTVRFQTNNCDRLSPDDICESSDSNGNIEVIKRDRQSSSSARQRPKSDLGGALLISDALKDHEFKESLLKGSSSQVSMVEYGLDGSRRYRDRRMSTPHPIKLRGEKRRPSQKRKQSLQRSCSAPDGINHAGKLILRKTSATLAALSTQVGELAVSQYNHTNFSSSDNDDSSSLDSESVISRRSSQSTFTNIEEIFDEDQLTFAEALWDHVTMDPDELPFRAGDVIEVTDMLDKDWWWGCVDDFEGWFPAAFVRLRVNQEETAEDFALKIRSGQMDSKTAMRRMSMSFVSKDQARSNVVNEIINAEREYVKHLKDVVQGYIVHARKRPEMFSPETLSLIFGNLEELYTLSQNFVKTLENAFNPLAPHTSQIGLCFLKHRKEFVIYSEYCNNHPAACAQLQELTKHSKYQQFFEACRLLQDMIEIPLEGFLLTPIQKICKYPLQLAELLKYTHASHPDYDDIQDALEAMKEIAALINERKRKLESIEKIALWQKTVQDWEGPDLLDTSSELIHQGDLSKVTLSSGWAKDRVFFLFDNQLVYCKKDLLKRNVLTFSGRLNINYCDIIDVADGKDSQFNLNARNAWKIYDRYSDKWLMMYAKSSTEKLRWLQAFKIERERVREDVKSGFNLTEQMKYTITHGYMRRIRPDKPATDKSRTPRKVSGMPFPYKHELLRDVPTPVSLPRATTNTANTELQSKHRRPWLIFGSKKATKR